MRGILAALAVEFPSSVRGLAVSAFEAPYRCLHVIPQLLIGTPLRVLLLVLTLIAVLGTIGAVSYFASTHIACC